MITSRCGILCNECSYRAAMGCAGCTKIEQPFWGAGGCPVKDCCEEKRLVHCGQCAQFPCALLNGFAYDKEQGDGGKRLRQCESWQEEESLTQSK